jgi:hypothetical protein
MGITIIKIVFLITVAEGNGRNPVITNYKLDLQNKTLVNLF